MENNLFLAYFYACGVENVERSCINLEHLSSIINNVFLYFIESAPLAMRERTLISVAMHLKLTKVRNITACSLMKELTCLLKSINKHVKSRVIFLIMI